MIYICPLKLKSKYLFIYILLFNLSNDEKKERGKLTFIIM